MGLWPTSQCQTWVLSCRTGLKTSEKLVGPYRDIHSTLVYQWAWPACQASCHCDLQRSELGQTFCLCHTWNLLVLWKLSSGDEALCEYTLDFFPRPCHQLCVLFKIYSLTIKLCSRATALVYDVCWGVDGTSLTTAWKGVAYLSSMCICIHIWIYMNMTLGRFSGSMFPHDFFKTL